MRSAGDQRGQSAGPAAPRAQQAQAGARIGAWRWATMSFLSGLRRLRSRYRGLVCQEVVELVTDYLEGALSSADNRRFEAHLAGCPHCTEYLA
ncbi:MAG: zf-HC2 domain-containing protein, partial [Trebonia sp.]